MVRSFGLALVSLALLATAVGCGSESEDAARSDDLEKTADVPRDGNGNALPIVLDGTYELSTPLDITSIGVLPATVSGPLGALSNFKEKPTQTLLDLMAAAKVPGADILNAIPGPIRPYVTDYIDSAIFDRVFEGSPAADRVATLLDDVGGIATKSNIITRLELPPGDKTGETSAKHSVRGLGFIWGGKINVVDVPAAVASKVAPTSVSANIAPIGPRSKDLELGRLQLEAHKFAIPLGTVAVAAMDKLATERFGADLRGSLGKLIDCAQVAETVSKRCINPPGPGEVCVGHKTEIQSLCTQGLDLLVDNAKNAIKQLDITMNIDLGVAQMWDPLLPTDALDAKADRLDVGIWKATYEAFGNKKAILTTFTGQRGAVDASTPAPK